MPPTPMKGAKPQLSAEQLAELKEAFNLFDMDGGGSISYTELKTAMKALGIKVKKDELMEMIKKVDKDASGEIEFDEFCDMMSEKMGTGDTMEDVKKVFTMFDTAGSGKITFEDLKRVSRVRAPSEAQEGAQHSLSGGHLAAPRHPLHPPTRLAPGLFRSLVRA